MIAKAYLHGLAGIIAFELCFYAVPGSVAPARAEFSQGIGEIGPATAEASAKLNDAFAAFHTMMAAFDRGRTDDAEKHWQEALMLLQQAANAYESAKPDGHTLNPETRNDQERFYIKYFRDHAGEFKVQQPTTQSALIYASSRLVREFRAKLEAVKVPQLGADIEARQVLVTSSAELQKFLVSSTTMLRLG
jgi:hypothetical protein